jgi:hypothetical protein
MHTRAAMKDRRYICVKPLRSAGLDGGTRSFKGKDLTQGILSNWQHVMLNCEL